VRRVFAALAVASSALASATAFADAPAVSASASASVSTASGATGGAPAALSTGAPAEDEFGAAPPSTLPEAPAEAPPPLPRKKGLVFENSLGALGYAGQFRHVAPPGVWFHAQLGWELLRWLMIFGEGEMTYTDTSEAQDETNAHAVPIFGFGGGLRFTLHFTERVASFVQGQIGAMRADVPTDELTVLGFRNAESFNVYFGGRLGLEYYQLDRHLAFGIMGGARDAQGFAKVTTTGDTGLMWDAAATIRYTF
jgi:hypothetical protein